MKYEIPDYIKDLPENLHFTILPMKYARRTRIGLLSEQDPDSRLLIRTDFPDGAPGNCVFRGKRHTKKIMGIISKFTTEEIFDWVEEHFPADRCYDEWDDPENEAYIPLLNSEK